MVGSAITVEPAVPAEDALLAGMLQFYIYDFSEMEPADSTELELEPTGRFKAHRRDPAFWREKGRNALIIRKGAQPIGFALLNEIAREGAPVVHNMADFFVMRKHRRGGVATAAVRAILQAYPGRWEVAIAERNTAAKAFWPTAIAATPGAKDVSLTPGEAATWDGPIYSFVVAS